MISIAAIGLRDEAIAPMADDQQVQDVEEIMTAIQTYVETFKPALPFMHLFHSTKAAWVGDIYRDRHIKAKNHGYVFLFYGKPSYTMKAATRSINEIAFVVSSSFLNDLKGTSKNSHRYRRVRVSGLTG